VQVRKSNVLKDFITMAGPLGVSHLLLVSRTDRGPNLRMLKLPDGPTLQFSIKEYSLIQDIRAVQKKVATFGTELQSPPLVRKDPLPR